MQKAAILDLTFFIFSLTKHFFKNYNTNVFKRSFSLYYNFSQCLVNKKNE